MQDEATSRRRLLLAGLASCLWPAFGFGADRNRLTLATGAVGGGFHEQGPALAELVARHAPLDIDVQPTGGSHDNIRRIGAGEADLGLVSMGAAHEAWHGRKPFAAAGPYRSLRALLPLYGTPFGLVVPGRRGVARLSELAGRTVGAGPAGGSAQVHLTGLAAALGLDLTIATGAPADLAERLIAGEIDAFWFGSGTPLPAFAEVVGRAQGIVLGLAAEEIAAFRRAFPYAGAGEIAAGTYEGQDRPLPTASVWTFVLGTDRLAETDGYEITRAVLDHVAELTADLPRLAGATLGNVAANSFLPFQAGALRYYADKGLAIPEALRNAG